MSIHEVMKESDYTGYKDMQILNAAWNAAEKVRRETTYKELAKQTAPDKKIQMFLWRNWDNHRSIYDMAARAEYIRKKEATAGINQEGEDVS